MIDEGLNWRINVQQSLKYKNTLTPYYFEIKLTIQSILYPEEIKWAEIGRISITVFSPISCLDKISDPSNIQNLYKYQIDGNQPQVILDKFTSSFEGC